MRLVWDDRALVDLDSVSDRAPRGAADVYREIQRLVRSPFPGMYRRVEGRLNEHVQPVPPYAVFYEIEGDSLTITAIADARRRREPW